MYVKAFNDGTIPDTETLPLTHLPDRVCWPTVTANPAKPNQLPTASEATKLNESDTFKIILWKEQIGQLIQGQTQKFTNAYLVIQDHTKQLNTPKQESVIKKAPSMRFFCSPCTCTLKNYGELHRQGSLSQYSGWLQKL